MRANLIPGRYRGVAVAHHDGAWDEDTLRARFLGREAYVTTRFLVVVPSGGMREGGPVALLGVERAPDQELLFAPITRVELLAGPDQCALLVRPDVDTAIPSALAAAAVAGAPDARAVVVRGRYEHVNVVVGADPLPVRVREVVPPHPAKLVDQVRRVVAVTEGLRPVTVSPEVVELTALATGRPAEHYLLPCRGGGGEVPGATLSYLDERPEPADWVQLGCERSRQIHRWFYGHDAPRVDLCPKRDLTGGGPGALLTKCCLQQEELDEGVAEGPDGTTRWVSVPWGSSLEHVRDALLRLTAREDPPWSPA